MGHQNRSGDTMALLAWPCFHQIMMYLVLGILIMVAPLPITEFTSIGAIIKEYGSDTFESIVLHMSLNNQGQCSVNFKFEGETLLNETAKAFLIFN